MNTKLCLALAGLILSGASAFAYVQDRDGRGPRDRGPRVGAHQRRHAGSRARVRELMRGRVADRLGVTEAQREQLRAQAESVRPVAEQFRAEARAILRSARDGAATREQTRRDLKALFERYRAQLEPNARSLVDALTPEQRAKLERRAERRGRTLDDDRMQRTATKLLLRRSRAR